MLHCLRQSIIFVNRLVNRNLTYNRGDSKKLEYTKATAKKLHTTTAQSAPTYAETAILPIPNNIDAAETTHRFSPHRARDISATVILSHFSKGEQQTITIDITADNSGRQDPHVQSYDCCGTVSLNSAMQSNVPSPFGGMHKFSHLNMPGGQWSQDCKFLSQNQHSSHYTALRDNARSGWVDYDQDATVNATFSKGVRLPLIHSSFSKRNYCSNVKSASTPSAAKEPAQDVQKVDDTAPPSKKEQLKKAFKDYGATVVVFHVTISLASLGGCYALVSGGIDLLPVLDYLGLASSALSNKIATGASTFVVAYAIHKVFAPVRISITLGATPFIVRYLRTKGFLKPKVIIKQK